MVSDRIGKKSANLVAVPPFEVRKVTTSFILKQETVKENIRNVPLNEPLVESIQNEGFKNPILTMANWYPLAGSQRVRAVAHIVDNLDPKFNLDIVENSNQNSQQNTQLSLFNNAEQVSREIRNTTSNEGEGQFFGSAQK